MPDAARRGVDVTRTSRWQEFRSADGKVIRVARRPQGCELRTDGKIVFGNHSLLATLEFLRDRPGSDEFADFAAHAQMSPDAVRKVMQDTLDGLVANGFAFVDLVQVVRESGQSQ